MAIVCCVTGSVGDSESEAFVKFDAVPIKPILPLDVNRLVFTKKKKKTN